MSDCILDSDVVIWYLRGRQDVGCVVRELAGRHRLCVSAITRAEVLCGMRDKERKATLQFLDACKTVPVSETTADIAADLIRNGRKSGRSVSLPDALIAASAIDHAAPLYSCNVAHMQFDGLELRPISTDDQRPSA